MNREKNPHIDDLSKEDLFARIGDICSAVSNAINGRHLLEISLRRTMNLFSANRGSIFILNEDGKELVLKIAQGMEFAEQENLVKRLGEGVVGKVAESKQPLWVEDISKDSRFSGYKPRKEYKTPSFICSPLLIKDKLIGVINIADKESGHNFSKQELQLLDFLSSQIALNYRRVQLYKRFKDALQESKTLKDELGKKSEVTDRLRQQVVLQEKLASIGKLTGGIAHELNNPLDGVLRYINLSLDHIKEDDVVRDYLLEAKQGLNRMVVIVRSLLACSRGVPTTMRKINVNRAIEEALSTLKGDLYHKNITIKKEFDENLPEIMDYGIERVASNLFRNALDVIEDKGEIQVKAYLENNQIVLEFHDNGCGIPKENVDKLFEPFYTTKDIDKGCGLGLTIVSEIVKAYNGHIDIESVPGKGTTFFITLPVEMEHAERR